MYLHSNMVRFIIGLIVYSNIKEDDLHSNMVRFIMFSSLMKMFGSATFTFQYG